MPIPFRASSIDGLATVLAALLLLGIPVPRGLAQAGLNQERSGSAARTTGPPQAGTAASAEPADLSQLIPEEAQVSMTAESLRVVAKNSSLVPILESVARMTGMEILNPPEESPLVSGNYGPGPVRKVLVDLMSEAGYNFVMTGGVADRAPSKLLLEKPRNSALETRMAASPLPSPASDAKMPKDATLAPEEPLGPGALRATPADAPVDENERIQRNLQRLQHIQEQQELNAPQ